MTINGKLLISEITKGQPLGNIIIGEVITYRVIFDDNSNEVRDVRARLSKTIRANDPYELIDKLNNSPYFDEINLFQSEQKIFTTYRRFIDKRMDKYNPLSKKVVKDFLRKMNPDYDHILVRFKRFFPETHDRAIMEIVKDFETDEFYGRKVIIPKDDLEPMKKLFWINRELRRGMAFSNMRGKITASTEYNNLLSFDNSSSCGYDFFNT